MRSHMNAENLKAAEAVEAQKGTAIIREVWVEAESHHQKGAALQNEFSSHLCQLPNTPLKSPVPAE